MSKAGLKKYLSQFPNNAKNWNQATDEVREIAKLVKEYYNEYENKNILACNFKLFATPSKWNTEGKKYIFRIYDKMDNITKKEFNKKLKDLYNID